MRIYFVKLILARTYRYLLLACMSILVGTFLFGGIFALTKSLSNYFIAEGKILTGGDVVISGNRPIDTELPPFSLLKERGYTVVEQYSVQAVFNRADKTKSTPATIRAVDPGFPLYGDMMTEPIFSLTQNTLYAEQAFFDRIGIQIGDTVTLGETSFVAIGAIISEPDAISFGLSFTPKVIIRRADLMTAGIDISQSRTSYRVALRHNQDEILESDIIMLEEYSKANKLRFDNALDGPNRFIRGLSSVERFIAIILSIALFLVSVNIIANLTYILGKMKKMIALLKTFGAKNSDIQWIFILIFGIIGVGAGSVGGVLSVAVTRELLLYFGTYITGDIPRTTLWSSILVGGGVGMAIMLASAVPFLFSLKNVSPKQLLTLSPITGVSFISRALPYGVIPLVLALVLYILSSSVSLVFYSILILLILFLLFLGIAHVCIKMLGRYQQRFGYIIQASIASLQWRGVEALVIISAIMTAFSGVGIVSVLEKNIEVNINKNISQQAPSLYIIDITQSQLQGVRDIVGPLQAYPIIRGRLLSVNDRDLTLSTDPGVTREFNMTYRDTLIDGENIVGGDWHGKTTTNVVSIDQEFAREIGGVKIGDTIEVFIQGITIQSTITSIRETDQSSGMPFFYLVFSPDVLSSFPASYFGTVDIPDVEISGIEQKLGQTYPNIIPLQTAKILDTVTSLVSTLVRVVQLIGLPSILLGLMLVIVMTIQSLFERRKDVLVLRAFGFSRRATTMFFVIEISAIILIASIVSFIIAHLLTAIVNGIVFDFDTFVFDFRLLWIIGVSLLSAGIAAYLVSLSLSRTPLRKLLSEK